MPILVYSYGLRTPEDEEAVRSQLKLAHEYYNALIAIENTRREAIQEAYVQFPELKACTETVERLAEELKVARATIQTKRGASRSAKVARADQGAVKELQEQCKAARAVLRMGKALRRDDETFRAQCVARNKAARAEVRRARKSCKVYWGTYLLVEQSVDLAKDTRKAGPLKRHHWHGEGCLGVQLQKGLTAAKASNGRDTRLRLPNIDPSVWEGTRSHIRQNSRLPMQFRIGTVPKTRTPIWLTGRLNMCRPLPPGAVIKWAKVVCRLRADKRRYQLQLTLEVPARVRAARAALTTNGDAAATTTHGGNAIDGGSVIDGGSAVGVDVGWRKMPDGTIRVACWEGTDGRTGDVRLPASVMDRIGLSDSLRSIRDRARNEMQPKLVAAIRKLTLPKEFEERVKTIGLWDSSARFVGLLRWWTHNRVDGDAAAYERLALWNWLPKHKCTPGCRAWHGDLHLWRYEEGARRGALLCRQKFYHQLAKDLTAYDRLVLEKMDLRDFAEHEPAESDVGDKHAKHRHQRFSTAPSILRDALVNTCRREGGQVIFVNPANTTRRCHQCDTLVEWNQARDIETTCSNGHHWDQDANAAKNLLALGQAAVPPPVAAQPRAPRFKPKVAKPKEPKPAKEPKPIKVKAERKTKPAQASAPAPRKRAVPLAG